MPVSRATQGDTLTLDTPTGEYTPGAGWSCAFQVAGTVGLTVAASVQDTRWVATVSSAQSLALGSGVVEWLAFVRHTDGRQVTIARGTVRLDPMLPQGADGLAAGQFARKRLAQVERAILAIEDALESYTAGEYTAKRRDLTSLYRERATLKREIAREDAAAEGRAAGAGITFRLPVLSGVLR